MLSLPGGVSKKVLRLAAVVAVGVAASGCSTVPSWVDPTSWLGPDVPAQADASDNGAYPDLANVPAKPATPSTEAQQQQVAGSLVAAGNNQQYSAESLRAGTEAAAAPPPAATPAPAVADTHQSAPQQVAQAAAPADENAAPEPSGSSAEQPEAASEPADQSAPAPAAAPANEVASAAEPAPVPAAPAAETTPAAVAAATSEGFAPSKAPPLSPEISQFVSRPILQRYAQTAAISTPIATGSTVALKAPKGVRALKLGTGTADVGGPESMSGAVVANLGALQSSAVSPVTSYAGAVPAAVVFFPGDITSITAAARAKIREAVAAYRSSGGQAYVRVVGHSSSRTGNMSALAHSELNYRKSLARATAVARELIREGVPADKVLVNAVGDAEPVYYESMPKGEDGNRRAEIFVQG
ncbi:MAG: OmpA family protein [Alphaproteobacteria bacterium]|nr:OmpA family protein [Alphaproteobacteria bacterium]MDE2012969.1 OmpA family protein [Alphaproteobacteria bacterium]MDE2073732.1 OmpA family protein [Alphaproteobacteria bacterium]